MTQDQYAAAQKQLTKAARAHTGKKVHDLILEVEQMPDSIHRTAFLEQATMLLVSKYPEYTELFTSEQ